MPSSKRGFSTICVSIPATAPITLSAAWPTTVSAGSGTREHRSLQRIADKRTTAELRGHLGAAHARAASCRQHDGSDAGPGRGFGIAGLRPGNDLHEQSPHAHAADISRRDGDVGGQPLEHPVEAIFLGRARAARRADHRLAIEHAQHQQVAGIDGHAQVLHHATSRPRAPWG